MKFLNWTMGLFLALFLSLTFVDVKMKEIPQWKSAYHQVIDLAPSIEINLLGTLAQAQEAAPVASAPEVKQPSYMDKVLDFVAGSSGLVAGLIILFEFLMRAFPTKKPLSFLVPAKYFCSSMAVLMKFLSDLLDKLIAVAQNSSKSSLG